MQPKTPATAPAPVKHEMGPLYEFYRQRAQRMAIENKAYTPDMLKIQKPEDIKVLTPPIEGLDLKNLLKKKKGGVDGGGGDSIGIEFQLAIADATGDYVQYSSGPKPDFDWLEINQYASSLHVVAVDDVLMSNNRPVIALNEVETKTVRVQRRMWNAIPDIRIKTAIALNMVLAMKKQKAFDFAVVPDNMLVAAGISGNALFDGQKHDLEGLELQNHASSQCLYGFEQQKRFFELWKLDVLMCTETTYPGLVKLRSDRFEQVATRCLDFCHGSPTYDQIHQACEAQAREYFELLKGFRRLTPKCVNQ